MDRSGRAALVNVAGGALRSRRTVSRDGTPHDRDAFEYTMAINALGTFNVSRLAAAAMAQNEPDGDGQRGVIGGVSGSLTVLSPRAPGPSGADFEVDFDYDVASWRRASSTSTTITTSQRTH